MIAIAHPLLGVEEEMAVLHVLKTGLLAQGEQVAAFEQHFAELCDVQEAVAVSSGTAALQLALLAHGIGPGDEVITTAFSFVATANAILLVGATPVFVDIEPDTYTLDPTAVKMAVTAQTKAILPVHLYGHPCDMEQLESIARMHNLIIIEDACQAHAAKVKGKPVGSFGTGCFSFYPTKNMTTGEGGMVTTNDPIIAERVRLMRNHGQKERYCHVTLGANLRMSEMQAAIGLVQLRKLAQFTHQRKANAQFLTKHLSGIIQTPISRPGYDAVYHQYTVRLPEGRDEWVTKLRLRGIGTGVHYSLPIYRQPFYQNSLSRFRISRSDKKLYGKSETNAAQLPETEAAAKQVLSLPVHPALNEENLFTIVREIGALCS